jgi:tryptophan-rich sensory protein
MLIAVAITTLVFWRIKRPAGLLFAPYLAWTAFAAFLNLTIWRLN